MMTKATKTLVTVIACSLIAAFACLVWPSRYRHTTFTMDGDRLPVRIDRFTGRTEILFPYGWRCVNQAESKPSYEEIDLEELSRPKRLWTLDELRAIEEAEQAADKQRQSNKNPR